MTVFLRLKQRLSRLKQQRALPPHAVIMLTNPRAGSTWLFDALRCHPAVDIHRTAALWTWLGLSGRRYPRDLSSNSDQSIEVEVKPGQTERLPIFALPEAATAPRGLTRFALEKCHPHFLRHGADAFVGQLNTLDTRLIYQIRDPRAAIISFLRYKERNPGWNHKIPPDEVVAFMQESYETILAVASTHPGMVIDYAQLEGDTHATLRRVFTWLWPETPDAANDALLTAIIDATRRDTRAPTAFLGAKVSSANDDSYAAYFHAHQAEIDACDRAYTAILALSTVEPRA